MAKLTEAVKKSLDEEIFEYHTIMREIALRKLEIETMREHDDNIGGSSAGIISKIPETLVIKYSEDARIQYLEKLKCDVEKLYANATKEQQSIIENRWLLGDANTWEEIAYKLHFSVKSMYRKREVILENYARIKGKL